ncbi:uncharacterized protein C19orf71 homolog isoform X3 [Ornithorhynchus anatinus]|uniref:uncharacterized protein C19orf71 homolog isoform X3 n=1 Tax=Ornithorhynchus anatinus TaxID=9258 RepID=UPI000454AD15|nr:uncharacterized protein C19orf71 homolog isoform X3 [Ornithorhynchus anatinus]
MVTIAVLVAPSCGRSRWCRPERSMEWLNGEVDQPYIPKSVLELDSPTPQFRDEYLFLARPRSTPLLKQALRWKCVAVGCDATDKVVEWKLAPLECDVTEQLGYPGMGSSDHCRGWYTLLQPIKREAYTRWSHSYAQREKALPRAPLALISSCFPAEAEGITCTCRHFLVPRSRRGGTRRDP